MLIHVIARTKQVSNELVEATSFSLLYNETRL